MKTRWAWAVCVAVGLAGAAGEIAAGVRGGGGRPAGSGRARPAVRPSGSNLGGGRPMPSAAINRPAASRPPMSRPASRPNFSRPAGGTGGPGGSSIRPAFPPTGIAGRPSTLPHNRPSPARPSRPETLPATRPSVPNLGGGDRPGFQRPGGIPSQRPGERPGIVQRPGGDRPGGIPSQRPGGGLRPGESRPGIIGQRPGGERPGERPGFVQRPAQRPSPGSVGDFLGLDRPVTLPAGIGGRPGDRPARPGAGNRPTVNWPNRGDINLGNQVVNRRPGWVNIDNDRVVNINNNWGRQITGLQNWQTRYPGRAGYWHGWADGVRHHWSHYNHCHHWFTPDWWGRHPHGLCGWSYYHGVGRYPARYWWTVPTFAALGNWFSWPAPAAVWSQPVYYDYGQGGNVVYENNAVYINGEQIATADEFAQTAATLATVEPPASEEQAAQAEWMPLGTFAVTADKEDVDPSRVIQLAVDRQGIISGTLYNIPNDQALTVQGRVDKQTQRVAFRLGQSEAIVVETGLYNLTQDEAPVLVHHGADKVETWLLVRLPPPADEPQ